MLEDDLRRIKASGIDYIRMAEFAWSLFEPEEGVFTFEYFDHVLERALSYDLKVILCTPTATPPAWLTHSYPEVLNSRLDGTSFGHGHRRHYTYNSEKYRELSSIIVTKLAQHYGEHPAVVGWQIDNEFNCEISEFYSEADRSAFRDYLRKKYRTLAALNDAWGNRFWNQEYTEWEQVSLSKPTIQAFSNPHLMLEEKRFFSASAIDYCSLQSEILRKYSPGKFLTTNSVFGHLDKHAMTEQCLDFMCYDSYPNFSFEMSRTPESDAVIFDDRWSSLSLSRVRSISPVFGIAEQQSGACGWIDGIRTPAPKPGQLRLWTFQSIAHGADLVSYFRWRTASFGTEMYWQGINDCHNQQNRRITEVLQVSRDIKKITEVTGKEYAAEVGILHDYDSEWDGELDQWHGPLSRHSEDIWFKALQLKHIPADILQMEYMNDEILKKYQLLVYPHAAVMTEERAALLERYVRSGGKIIFGCRSGYKDANGRCLMQRAPGYLKELCGMQVKDYTLVRNNEPVPEIRFEGAAVKAPMLNDILEPDGAEVLGVYSGAYYEDEAAVTKNQYGKGCACYHGSAFTLESTEFLIEGLGMRSPAADLMELSAHIELAVRGDFIFLLNYTGAPQWMRLKKPLTDELRGASYRGSCELPAYEVVIFKVERRDPER